MICPNCDCLDMAVTDSRPTAENLSIRRRRHCNGCGHRFTTFEIITPDEFLTEAARIQRNTGAQLLELLNLMGALGPEDARLLIALARRFKDEQPGARISLRSVA